MIRYSLQHDLKGLAELVTSLHWTMSEPLADETDEQFIRRFLRSLDTAEEQVHRIRGVAASKLREICPPPEKRFSTDDSDLPF